MRLLLTIVAFGCLAAGQAVAAPFQAAGVDVKNAAAVLTVIAEDRNDIDATVGAGARLPAPSLHVEAGRLVIDGGVRVEGCGGWFQVGPRVSIRVAGYGAVAPEQLQHITLHVPRTLNLSVSGGVHSSIGASLGGHLELNGCGRTDVGDASGPLEVGLNGSGDAHIGAVSGALRATLNGSGDIAAARVGGDATLRLRGSGDVGIGEATGALDAELVGSGDVRVGGAAGARLTLVGSGDVEVGDVRGPLQAGLDGSGDVRVRSVAGPSAELRLSASGDINVRAGHAEALTITNSGSGDVRFGGGAGSSRLVLHGSGDISVADAGRVETLNDSGSGAIHVGK